LEGKLAVIPGAIDRRLAALFARMRRGEDIVVAAIGGSITTGYAAPDPSREGWFALAGEWWKEKAASRGAKAELRNRGLCGTDSLWANFRIDEQAKGADFVFMEFAMNDQWLDPAVRRPSYEACLRRLLSAQKPPAVLALFLNEKADRSKGQAREQEILTRYYGLPAVDFGKWQDERIGAGGGSWDDLFDGAETIHPNAAGHRAIAECLVEFLEQAWKASEREAAEQAESGRPANGRLAEALYVSDFCFTELWDSGNAQVLDSRGWSVGGDAHGEWQAHGGCPNGWRCATEGAVLELKVKGRVIGVLYSESDAYRDLEAWVDDEPPVSLPCRVEYRKGYLGWASRIVARALPEGEHVLRLRLKNDASAGSGRSACLVAAFAAGAVPEPRLEMASDSSPLKYESVSVRDPRLRYTGRFAPAAAGEPLTLCWQGSSLECEFEGRGIAFGFESRWGRNWMNADIDGLTRIFEVPEGKSIRWDSGRLGAGRHRVRLFKRSEGHFGALSLVSVELEGRLLGLPPRPPLRLEFYGDSITAGACNLDACIDQYDTLAPHDNAQSYPAVAARELGAEYVGIAVSGTGITCSWNPIILGEVCDLSQPVMGAPRGDFSKGAPGGGPPDIVLINLGQNDFGLPDSRGEPLSREFAARYVEFARRLRKLHPECWIVCTIGGMSAYRDSADLREGFLRATEELKSSDGRLSTFVFKAFTANHPRVDTHALLARELCEYLDDEVLPRIGKRRTVGL
jgi:lysophospholipase L1-like esterase